ncbi:MULTISPECIES: hypothetical protein [unclassified Thiocapsa]|uniref:hypothetical protein n=1 Tax=unclassified Thiocapsa TaxID=2641286 RepID=UPI0035B261B3
MTDIGERRRPLDLGEAVGAILEYPDLFRRKGINEIGLVRRDEDLRGAPESA